MTEIYKIEDEKLSKFMAKKAGKDAGLMAAIVLGFLIVIGLMTEFKVIWMLGKAILPFVVFFLLMIFLFSFLSSNLTASTRFIVDDNFVGKAHESNELNLLDKYTLNSLQRKTGQKKAEMIHYDDIKSIAFKKDKIVIKSKDYNMMNGNGRIVIPEETQEFGKLKEYFSETCKLYNNITRMM